MKIRDRIIEFQKCIRDYRHESPQYYAESETTWRQLESLLSHLAKTQGPVKFRDKEIARKRLFDLKDDTDFWNELSRRILKNNPGIDSTEAMKEASALMDSHKLRL